MMLYAQIINQKEGATFTKISFLLGIMEVIFLLSGAKQFGVNGVLGGTLLLQAISCLLLIRVVRKTLAFERFRKNHFYVLPKYYSYGFYIFVAGFAAWMIDSSDTFVVGRVEGADQLGIYRVVYGLSNNLAMLSSPFFAALMPFLVQGISEHRTQEAQRYLSDVLKTLLFIFCPAVILFSVNGQDILQLLTTAEFAEGAQLIPFISLGVVTYQLLGVFTSNLHAHQQGHVLLITIGLSAGLNLILNIIFIPKYGTIAAALSTLLSYQFMYILDWLFSRRILHFGLELKVILKLGIAAIGMFACTLVMRQWLLEYHILMRLGANILASGSLYLVVLFALSFFGVEDIVNIKNVLMDR